MTTRRNLKIYFVVLAFLCITYSVNFWIFYATAYDTHLPIGINNNGEFQAAAIANGWAGDGLTAASAYIIENYDITDDDFELIAIENTNVYFEIRHCYFDNVEGGTYDLDAIYLKNVQNGIIFNNTIENSRHGVFIDEGCSNIIVDDNIIDDTSESGLRVNNSDSIDILNNQISTSVHHAIWINQTSNSVISGNNLTDCYNGIWIREGSTGNNITDNYIEDTTNGIWITNSSDNNNVYFNVVNSTEYGIVIADQTAGTDVVNNTVIDCTDYGISIDDTSSSNTISQNSFVDNNLGGSSQGIDNGSSNTFNSNYWNEWTTPDLNDDGVVDDPYLLDGTSGSSDSAASTTPHNPVGAHILTPASIVFPLAGASVNGTISVLWSAGYDSFDHEILYNLSYRYNTSLWYPIEEEISVTSASWNTTEVEDGTGYQIRVTAYCEEDLVEVAYSGRFTINHTTEGPGPGPPPDVSWTWVYIIGGAFGATIIAVTVTVLVIKKRKSP